MPKLAGVVSVAVLGPLLVASGASADEDLSKVPYRGAPETVSTGQPVRAQAQWGPALGYTLDDENVSGRVNLGINAEFLLPQFGFLDFTMEGAVGFVGSELDGAFSSYLKFPYVSPGFEYSFRTHDIYFKLTLMGAPRRGGLIGIGDRLRVDWVPQTGLIQFGMALEQPFGKYRRNRPRNRHVHLAKVDLPESRGLDPELVPYEIIGKIEDSITWMDRLLTPRLGPYDPASDRSRKKFDERANELRTRIEETGHSFANEDARYHENLIRAFAHTAGGNRELGDTLAREAERILFERVLIPTNQMFGRMKKPVDLTSFMGDAAFEFSVVLGRAELNSAQSAAAGEVFRSVMLQINSVAKAQNKRWKDSRMVWLPLDYGLRPEQHDTQEELNGLFEQIVGLGFTADNDIGYLFADDFYYFYRNLILETEHYQVTIIHDFRNKTGKHLDEAAWGIVADGYIEAFIRAIEAMDRGERDVLPEFILFLDEHYYRANRSRQIISFLENLHEDRLVTLEDAEIQARVLGQQRRLQETIAASSALDRFAENYVERNVKIHVNITHQFDPTFKEDAIARDHRKIAFRDVFEEDPGAGVAVFTGVGIGNYYMGPSWEDRSLLLRGAELVKLKTETRRLFLHQGYRPEEVPYFLRARPFPDDYAQRCHRLREQGWTAGALMTVNQTGFRQKSASVARMALYNLMPRGSLILVPDSIWASDYWAAHFVALALRGIHVYAVAPGKEHAPSSAPPTLALIRESLAAMLRGVEMLGPEMKRAGGSLHVGIFEVDFDVCDPLERVEAFLQVDHCPHLTAGGFCMHPDIYDVFVAERDFLRNHPDTVQHVTDFGEDRKTKLHQKTQFFATQEGIEILNRPEWASFLARYLQHHR